MGDGWDGTPEDVSERIAALFDVSGNHDYGLLKDDFCLAMEDCTGAPHAYDDWRYTTESEVPLTSLEVGPARGAHGC